MNVIWQVFVLYLDFINGAQYFMGLAESHLKSRQAVLVLGLTVLLSFYAKSCKTIPVQLYIPYTLNNHIVEGKIK